MAEPALPVYATTAPSIVGVAAVGVAVVGVAAVGVAAVGVAAVGVSMDGSSYMHVGGPTCKMTSMVVHGSHLFDHKRSAMHNLQSYTHLHIDTRQCSLLPSLEMGCLK